MSKEAKDRIKIKRLLDHTGWLFFDLHDEKAKMLIEGVWRW
jgi:hypothetical protein